MSQDLCIHDAIISYPTVFNPKQINGKGPLMYSCTLILPANFDYAAAEVLALAAIAAEPKLAGIDPATIKRPWQDASGDGFPGQGLVKCYSDTDHPFQIVDQNVNPVLDQGLLFAGCVVLGYGRVFAYNNAGNTGVSFGLNIIQIKDNVNVTRLDGTKSAAQVCQPIAGAPVATAPGFAPQGQPPAQQFAPQGQPPQPGAAVAPGAPQQQAFAPGAPAQNWQQ